MSSYNPEDIIYALATAFSSSAIAVIRVSGKGCISLLEPHFSSRKKLSEYKSSTAVFGNLKDIDQCVITIYKGNHSYTGEEALEISCHGGLETIKSILSFLEHLNMRQAQRGEFTLRAFLHGKMDLTKAEAVNELINSKGKTGALLALNRLNGALFEQISQIKAIVSEIMAIVEVQLDYAEDEIGEDLTFPIEKLDYAIEKISKISSSYNTGRLYSQGAKIVLAGSTNAGKSSLFNYFLKEDRAIVSSTEGTTRDYIEASCTIDSIPVRLFDTAGLRDSSDEIEKEGILRSQALMDSSDLIIYLIDCSKPVIDKKIVSDPRCICVSNKTDIASSIENTIALSVKTGLGFDKLCDEISRRLKKDIIIDDDSMLVIENQRQKDDLNTARSALISAKEHVLDDLPLDIVTLDIQEALEALGEITGEVTTDDILDKIFANFCVGK